MEDYFNRKSNELKFWVEQLERQFHITKILSIIQNDSLIRNNTILKGGTAIQGIWCNLSRFSYDIDLDFIGEIIREKMEKIRNMILEQIKQLGEENGYIVVRKPSSYIMERLYLKYDSFIRKFGKIKLEINFLNRIPLIKPVEKNFINIFPEKIDNFIIKTYDITELLAMKTVTFLRRKYGRDFFDIFSIINLNYRINFEILKKLILLNLCMIPRQELQKNFEIKDFQHFINKFKEIIESLIDKIIENEIKLELPRNFPMDIREMKIILFNFYSKIPILNESEKQFWEQFFFDNVFEPELIFDKWNIINKNIKNHPSIFWRIQQNSSKN